MAFVVFKEDTWVERLKIKVAATVGLATIHSINKIEKYKRTFLQDYPKRVAVYGGATLTFYALQETIRKLRSGANDPFNSLAAGAISGALLVGHYQGPQYRVLGATVWGSIAAMLHLGNQVLKPRYIIEDFLIENNLLSPKVIELRPVTVRNAKQTMKTLDELSLAELMEDVELIRFRELQNINSLAPNVYDDQKMVSLSPSTYFSMPLSMQKRMNAPVEFTQRTEWKEALDAAQEPAPVYESSSASLSASSTLSDGPVEITTYEEVEDDEDFQSWLRKRNFNPDKV